MLLSLVEWVLSNCSWRTFRVLFGIVLKYSRTTSPLLLVGSQFFWTTSRQYTPTKYIFFWKLTNRGIQNTNKKKRVYDVDQKLLARTWQEIFYPPIEWADNFLSTHRTLVFLPVLDSSIGQLSEKHILRWGILSISCPKKLKTFQTLRNTLFHTIFKYNRWCFLYLLN